MKTKIFYGLPGTGKTTALINKMSELLNDGYKPSEICVNTFRRSMAKEFIDRAIKTFGKIDTSLMGTMHSICYHLIDYKNVANGRHLKKFFNDVFGLDFKDKTDPDSIDDISSGKDVANAIADIYHIVVNTKCTDDYTNWRNIVSECGNKNLLSVDDEYVELFFDTWPEWKKSHNIIDFNDMLLQVYENELAPDASVLISDEFQDFTRLQYEIFKIWRKNCDVTYIAGDEFQSIYLFWGSSPEFIRKEMKKGDVKILPTTYRFGDSIWDFSTKIITYKDVPEINCSGVSEPVYYTSLDNAIKLTGVLTNELNEDVLILVRAGFMGISVAWKLASYGIPFRGIAGWTDKQIKIYNSIYKIRHGMKASKEESKVLIDLISSRNIIGTKKNLLNSNIELSRDNIYNVFRYNVAEAILNSPYPFDIFNFTKIAKHKMQSMLYTNKLIDPNNIHVKLMTIHASKGLQSDNVIVLRDIPFKVKQSLQDYSMSNNEERVFFVACTRAKKRLIISDGKFDGCFKYNLPISYCKYIGD